MTLATATDVGGIIGEEVTFTDAATVSDPPGGNAFSKCTWNGIAQPAGAVLPYDVSITIGVSDPYRSATSAHAQFLADSEYRASAGSVLGAVDTPLGDGAFAWVDTPLPSAPLRDLGAGTQSLEILAGNRIVTISITSIGEDQRTHGQQQFLARLVLGRLGAPGPVGGTPTTTTTPLSTAAPARMGRSQFLAAANALCRQTSERIPSVSDPTNLSAIAATAARPRSRRTPATSARLAPWPRPNPTKPTWQPSGSHPNKATTRPRFSQPGSSSPPCNAGTPPARKRSSNRSRPHLIIADQVERYLNRIGLDACTALEVK